MSGLIPAVTPGGAIGLDHIGIVGADLDVLAQTFSGLGFHLTPHAAHASGRTANRCIMLRDGGYLELVATVPGQSSATLDRFLGRGPGAHILALEVADEAAALDRLRRAGVPANEASITERDSGLDGRKARFALIMPPDPPEGRVMLIRQLTRDLLWRPDTVAHPNTAVALTEAVYASDAPAETAARLSRLSGRPAEPDPMGGYRIPLGRGRVRILPRAVAGILFPGATNGPPLIGLSIDAESSGGRVVHAGGVAIRFATARGF
ncbi:MAG: VOC family protein [Acetobacteraceae bacterium]|nr:VOC family protein [Acetobacteraceae bacterium]